MSCALGGIPSLLGFVGLAASYMSVMIPVYENLFDRALWVSLRYYFTIRYTARTERYLGI